MILPRDKHTNPSLGHKPHGPSGGAIAFIVIAVLVVVGIAAWILRTCLRARSLGLPAPTWRTFVPFVSKGKGSYEPTRPRSGGGGGGGLFGFLKPSSSRGGYTGAGARSERTRAAHFGDDPAWDSSMHAHDDHDDYPADGEYRGAAPGVKEAVGLSSVLPRGREQNLGAGMEQERGRSRDPAPAPAPAPAVIPITTTIHDDYVPPPGDNYGASRRGAEVYIPPGENPFEQDVAQQRKKDGFDAVRIQGGRASVDSERRSVFREGI